MLVLDQQDGSANKLDDFEIQFDVFAATSFIVVVAVVVVAIVAIVVFVVVVT